MTDAITQARATIEARLGELREETSRLEEALAALDRAGGERRGGGSSSPRRGGRSSSKRAPRGFRQGQFIKTVESTPGARPSEIARAMGIRPQQVHALARKLLEGGLIVKQGSGYAAAPAAKGSSKSTKDSPKAEAVASGG